MKIASFALYTYISAYHFAHFRIIVSSSSTGKADIVLEGYAPTWSSGALLFANYTDPVLIRNKDKIKDFGYVTGSVNNY